MPKTKTALLIGCGVIVALAMAAESLGQSSGANMTVHRDLDYIEGAEYADNRDRLDVYMPEGASSVPVIVFFHGGALRNGSKDTGSYLASSLVPAGIGVVSANYRLSPAVMHPAHLQDAAAAFAWTVEHIVSYGGDPDRVYLSGHSAGAYLAAQLSLDPRYLRAHGLELSAIRGAMPISPFLYVEEVAPDRPKTVWGENVEVWREASVASYFGPSKPPILLIYADGDADWRREQNERMAEELRAAGHEAAGAVQIENRTHATVLSSIENAGDPAAKLIIDFVQQPHGTR